MLTGRKERKRKGRREESCINIHFFVVLHGFDEELRAVNGSTVITVYVLNTVSQNTNSWHVIIVSSFL